MSPSTNSVTPPAARSCFHDRNKEGLITVSNDPPNYEWRTLDKFNHKLLADTHSPKSFTAAALKMQRKLDYASKGKLRFGKGKRYDVDQMEIRPEILELKFSDLPADCQDTQRWIRVYFTEPLDSPGELIRISINMKYANRPDQQTNDAIAAFDLLKEDRLA